MSQDQSESEPILFNYALREIDIEEWLQVSNILVASPLQGYEVASDWVSPDSRRDSVLPENISPSLEDLASHASATNRYMDEILSDPFLAQSELNAESDLRVYLVWRPGQDRAVELPVPVVIAFGFDQPRVVGFV
jgi:hypothetical protein